MYVSLQDLGFFLVAVAIVAIGVAIVITLSNVNKLVGKITSKIEANEKNVESLIQNLSVAAENVNSLSGALRKNQDLFESKLPESVNNLHQFSTSLKNTGEKVDDSVALVNASLTETAATVTENTQDALAYIKIVSEGIRILIDTLRKE